jgi:L-threonylcarbamoyladenylate synthase
MTVIEDQENLDRAAAIIRRGGLVAFPTETVYGLGANALDASAVARIFSAKERPSFDPLIVHIADMDDLAQLTPMAGDVRVQALAQAFWPGPLTLVLPRTDIVPDIVTSDLPTVGIRMPDHPLALALIRACGCPLAAPSANKFGRVSPTRAEHVTRNLPEVDMVLDGGPTGVGIESTIIRLDDTGFEILRPGAITAAQLSAVLPPSSRPAPGGEMVAPGMLKSHYSPRKPLYIAGTASALAADRSRAALLSFSGSDTAGYGTVRYLSRQGNLEEAAVNLFAAMHDMEGDASVTTIIVEPVPEEGIGIAIMDRVRKAAHDHQGAGAGSSD